ncbi:MAG: hypothetical protein RIA63_06035, partial [Cyclobacteriaceae bacterium]
MNILIVLPAVIPAKNYGGTERVIWYLGRDLVKLGHRVTYLVNKGSVCDFANVVFYDHTMPVNDQIPEGIDLVHLNHPVSEEISKPH